MPAISLIIPLYNAEKYLRPCLDSAKNQTFEDIEIICINDGSTDNTADIVNEYVAEDSRFRLIEQENAGCSMARNHGLKSAMSPYVALLDQDDVLHPQAMEVLHHLITKYNADVAEFTVKPGAKITKQAVKDLGLPKGATIGGLIRNGEGILVTGNTMIQENDHVVVFCLGMMIKKLEKYF